MLSGRKAGVRALQGGHDALHLGATLRQQVVNELLFDRQLIRRIRVRFRHARTLHTTYLVRQPMLERPRIEQLHMDRETLVGQLLGGLCSVY